MFYSTTLQNKLFTSRHGIVMRKPDDIPELLQIPLCLGKNFFLSLMKI